MFLDILDCEECSGYLLPEHLNLDLVNLGYSGMSFWLSHNKSWNRANIITMQLDR